MSFSARLRQPTLLLGRPGVRIGDLDRAAEFVRDRRVLVTGAAGSVGSPLSHTLLRAEPGSLVLLDHHEHSLFSLERALGRPARTCSYELADVRDAATASPHLRRSTRPRS